MAREEVDKQEAVCASYSEWSNSPCNCVPDIFQFLYTLAGLQLYAKVDFCCNLANLCIARPRAHRFGLVGPAGIE